MKQEELKKIIELGEPVRVIDVREGHEVQYDPPGLKFKDSTGAIREVPVEHIPMGDMFLRAKEGKFSKNEKIVAVCPAGTRCAIVAEHLKDKLDIEHLEGGTQEWKEE